MCGILGFQGSFDPTLLRSSLKLLEHRGPDDTGIFQSTGVGLGHQRLAILDLSPLGHQPMASANNEIVLVFNGEVYNFRQLRRELEAKGHTLKGSSDTEVVLNLYLTAGQDCLPRLNGIFAFAIWDNRDQTLFLARDGLGVKPLYYTTNTQGFAFSSEIKALVAMMPDNRELDYASLHRYMSFLWCPGNGTPLKHVKKLQAGEAMTVKGGRVVRRWTWYRLPAQRGLAPSYEAADAIQNTTTHLRNAVHRQMVADVPVGAFLSGGLDSSAVVAFAREANPNLKCFTIELGGGQEAGTADDLPYARAVARHLAVGLEVVYVDAAKMAKDLPMMVAQLDEPLADLAGLNVLYISRLAREHGMKVLLSGAGGDDLFSGYRRHRALHTERYWDWLPKSMRGALKRSIGRLDVRNPLARRLAKAFAGADFTSEERMVQYFMWAGPSTLFPLYSLPFRERLHEEQAEAPLLSFLADLPPNVLPLERMLALEQRFFLSDHNLLYTDKMSMAAGVEVRVPFLDPDLVEHAAGIAPGLKQRGRVGKWVLKKAMEPYLPKDIIYRPKSGFGAPLRRWMRQELRPLLGDLLSADRLRRRGLFDPASVARLIADNDSGRIDGAYTLLSLLSIELWCTAFLDNRVNVATSH